MVTRKQMPFEALATSVAWASDAAIQVPAAEIRAVLGARGVDLG